MVSEKVAAYVRNSLRMGHERPAIEERLRSIGLDASEIADAFRKAQSPTPAVDLTPQTEAAAAPGTKADNVSGNVILQAIRRADAHAGDFLEDRQKRNHSPFAPGARAYFALSYSVVAAFLSLPLLAVVVFAPAAFPILVLIPFLFAVAATYGSIYLSKYIFALEANYMHVRKGAFIHSYTLLPYENIQDIHVTQGMIERLFGATSVIIFTATTSGAGAESIPGLRKEDAEALKQGLFMKIRERRNVTD